MDYRTHNVGTPYLEPRTGQCYWYGRSIQRIAEAAGISYWACKRCIQGIAGRGAMTLFDMAGTDEQGETYGRPSLRNINPDLFQCIGQKTWKAFKTAGKAASQLWKDAQETAQAALEAGQRLKEKAKETAVAAAVKIKNVVVGSFPPELKEYVARYVRRPLKRPKPPDTS